MRLKVLAAEAAEDHSAALVAVALGVDQLRVLEALAAVAAEAAERVDKKHLIRTLWLRIII